MKKLIAFALVLLLATSVLVGCGAPEEPAAQEKDYALSVGVKVTDTLASSKVAQTVASIVTDKDGKIVVCRLDCIEYSAFDADGNTVTAAPTSKVAQGEEYDPNNDMGKGDWYKQAAALEAYVVGKTKSEVAAIALTSGKVNDLASSCTINVVDLLAAIDKAFDNEYKTAFKSKATAFTAGLVAQASVTVTEEDTIDAKFVVNYAAAVMADGKVAAAILDCAEPTIVAADKDAGAESVTYAGTKLEQGEDYDKDNYMAQGDWYKQAAAYAKTAVGKTKDDIATLAASGVAGCTIYAGGFKAAIEAAVKGAR